MAKAKADIETSSWWKRPAAFLFAALTLAPAAVFAAASPGGAPPAATPGPAPGATANPFGAYLAARHAQHARDYGAAAKWYEQALRDDPQSPELVARSFLMEASGGSFERARALATRALKFDPSDPMAELVLMIGRLKDGDNLGALAHAEALPQEGVHRFVTPLALAWTRMAGNDVAGAESALQGLDKFTGFAPLKYFQLALLEDFAGRANMAEDNFNKAIEASGQLNWLLTDALANFYQRHGRAQEARGLYQRFVKQNPTSEFAEAVRTNPPGGTPAAPVASAADGMAQALFDLASVLNQPDSIDLALFYDRLALDLQPKLPLAQMLLADILTSEKQSEQSLKVLAGIPANSLYSWSAQLRIAANLRLLHRTDQAAALLKSLAAAAPTRVGAELQLGDLLREEKHFPEAVAAYSEALRRSKAADLPERWSLYYNRGVALERSHQWPQAEADLLHTLKLQPDQPLVLNYLGYSWIDRGLNLDRALKMIEKAVELRPDDGYIVDSLGWAHYRLGDYTRAVGYLEKAAELVPEDPTINDHLGDAYWRTGRPVEARYQWHQALQFKPEQSDIKPIEGKLARGLQPAPPTPRGG